MRDNGAADRQSTALASSLTPAPPAALASSQAPAPPEECGIQPPIAAPAPHPSGDTRAAMVRVNAANVHELADFAVPDATEKLIREAVPENTALAYRSRWRSFEAWCAASGRVALPATAQTVAAYLTYLVIDRGLKATSVDAHLTAVRAVHRGAGAVPPDGLAARKVVVAAAKREAARDGRYGPRRALPVMAADLPAIVATCDTGTSAGLRDRAVLLLGFALLARRSELAALNLSDVTLVPGEGLEVTIRSSKTDQSARGIVRRVHFAANDAVCPVRAVLAWTAFLAAQGVTSGPLFTRVDRWGNLASAAGGRYARSAGTPRGDGGDGRDGRLRPQAIGTIVAAVCAAAGLAGSAGDRRFTGHSLRRGGATSMLGAGAQPLNVSRHGRWSDGSRSFAGYVEEAAGFGDANPTKGLLLGRIVWAVIFRLIADARALPAPPRGFSGVTHAWQGRPARRPALHLVVEQREDRQVMQAVVLQ